MQPKGVIPTDSRFSDFPASVTGPVSNSPFVSNVSFDSHFSE